jgi:hypothetical protein
VYADVKRNARSAVLKLIEREREGELIDKMMLKNILDIFIEVGFYSCLGFCYVLKGLLVLWKGLCEAQGQAD